MASWSRRRYLSGRTTGARRRLLPVVSAAFLGVQLAFVLAEGLVWSVPLLLAFLAWFRRKRPDAWLPLAAMLAALGGVALVGCPNRLLDGPVVVSKEWKSPLLRFRAQVEGVRTGEWRPGERWVRLVIRLRAPTAEPWQTGDRLILFFSRAREPWRVGDRVDFVGRPHEVRGRCNNGSDERTRLARAEGLRGEVSVKDDRAVLRKAAAPSRWEDLRGRIQKGIDRHAVEDSRPLLGALLLGDRSLVSPERRRVWARAGVAHLLAVSGLHIGVVALLGRVGATLLLGLLPRLGRYGGAARLGDLAGISTALAYTEMVGFQVAAMRAVWMLTFVGLGRVFAQGSPLSRFLMPSAALLLLVDPGAILSASFQLSFVAVAALLFGFRRNQTDRFDTRGFSAALRRFVRGTVRTSTLATLATAPILLHHFGEASLLGIVSNLLVAPLVTLGVLVVGLTGALLLAGGIPAGVFLGIAGELAVAAEQLAVVFSRAGFGVVVLPAVSLSVATGVVLVVFAGVVPSFRASLFCAATAFVLLSASWFSSGAPGTLSARFLDVGQGDAILLEWADSGEGVVFDAPGSPTGRGAGASALLPVLRDAGIGTLARIVATHPDWDHYGGFVALLDRVGVERFDGNGGDSRSSAYVDLRRSFARLGSVLGVLARGDRFAVGGAEVFVLHPPVRAAGLGRNDASIVASVRLGAVRLLLTGDIEDAGERTLLADPLGLGASLIKVPHHGSATSSHVSFLAAVRPAVAVAQVGRANRFGFPAADVRSRYRSLGALWLGTDVDGEVSVVTDGQVAEIRTCRPRRLRRGLSGAALSVARR